MVALEGKIDQFYHTTEESVNTIIEGSDEHLDLILSVSNPLNELNQEFLDFNEWLHDNINSCSKEDLNHILPRLKDINRMCMMLIGAIRTTDMYAHVRSALKVFYNHHDFLREMIYDIQHHITPQKDNLDNLLKDINDL